MVAGFGSLVVDRGGGICVECAEPQPHEQQGQRHGKAAEAVDDERGIAGDVPDQPGEVLAESR
jgi:hypothetical protein